MYKWFIKVLLLILILSVSFSFSNIQSPKRISIYWDSSLSMLQRNLEKDLDFLDAYFKNVTDIEVELIAFSNVVDLEKSFLVTNSNWSNLRETLRGIKYDGMTRFEGVFIDNGSDINILFTDGLQVYDNLKVLEETPTFIVNSSNKFEEKLLKWESSNTKGNFINLNKVDLKSALVLMQIENPILEKIKTKEKVKKAEITSKITDEEGFISGMVYNSGQGLKDAEVIIKGNNMGTVTDDKGVFKIPAKVGDVLVVKYLGMRTTEYLIDKKNDNSIELKNKNNNLDEVVVQGKTRKEVKVNTGLGEKDKSKLGYAVQSIGSEDIPVSRSDNIAVHGKFSGVTSYGQNDDISQMVMRANSLLLNVYPMIVVNGAPVARSSSASPWGHGRKVELTDFIDPSNIANITILKGAAATNRYGGEGSNGVILITTKTGTYGSVKNNKPYDRALIRDNDYEENVTSIQTSIKESYIDALNKEKGVQEKYNLYLKQRKKYLNDFQYFSNISDYFNQLGYEKLSTKILTNVLETYPNDDSVLRFIAIKAKGQKNFDLSESVYKRLIKNKPKEAQGYRDLALVYQTMGSYKKALNVYLNIESNKFPDVNFSGLRKSLKNEMRRLILRHKNELDLSGVAPEYLNEVNYNARIVFDWNDRKAEFEFQFVNPQKKFFTWSHTQQNNAARLAQEQQQGFNTEEFLLIGVEKGAWQINIESFSKSKKPIIVRYTVFKNFGKPNEIKESRVLILNNLKGKKMLGKIII